MFRSDRAYTDGSDIDRGSAALRAVTDTGFKPEIYLGQEVTRKEMTNKYAFKGDSHMKKTLLIVALAAVLVFAFASPAFAKYAGYSSSKQYVPWAEASSLASQNADAALQAFGPHAGYATTTIKCAVCHSVHRAGSKLLNEGAACAYCHTSTANGGGAVAADLISWNGTTNSGPHSGRCANTDCHGGPHGVGASTYAGPASRLISAAADSNIAADLAANALPVATLDTWNAQSRVIATGGLCARTGCHTNSMFGVVTAGAETSRTVAAAGQMVTGHRVIADATAAWAGELYGSNMTSGKGIAIAFKPVEYCNSCHDLTDDNNGGKEAFPHAINDVVSVAQGKVAGTRPAVWLTAAPDSATQSTVVGAYNDYSAADGNAAGGGIVDGVCLKCHKSATAGLGITY